jgi:isoquinoline 1-oxidoreductase subunit beta
VGEPGLPPIAPAVANAWRKLTGTAVRRLPFTVGGRA